MKKVELEKVYCKKTCTETFLYKKGNFYDYCIDPTSKRYNVYATEFELIGFPPSEFNKYFLTMSDFREAKINKLLE